MFLPVFFNKMQVPIYSSEQKLSFLKQKHPKFTGRIFTFLKVFQWSNFILRVLLLNLGSVYYCKNKFKFYYKEIETHKMGIDKRQWSSFKCKSRKYNFPSTNTTVTEKN